MPYIQNNLNVWSLYSQGIFFLGPFGNHFQVQLCFDGTLDGCGQGREENGSREKCGRRKKDSGDGLNVYEGRDVFS